VGSRNGIHCTYVHTRGEGSVFFLFCSVVCRVVGFGMDCFCCGISVERKKR